MVKICLIFHKIFHKTKGKMMKDICRKHYLGGEYVFG